MLLSAAVRVCLARRNRRRRGVPAEQAAVAALRVPPSAWLTIAALALLTIACGSSSDTQTFSGPSAVRCALRIETENAAFPPAGGSGVVRVSTDRECVWTAKAEAPWLVLSAGRGQGPGSVQFTVVPNAEFSSRSSGILVGDQRVQIAQQGRPCEFSVSSTRETVDGGGGDRVVKVRASGEQCGWAASANEPWITIVSGREGRGDGEVRFRVEAASGPPRTGSLRIAGHTVRVEQGTGCTYAIDTTTFSVDASGGDRRVAVEAAPGCPWTAESRAAWITITSGASGSGPGAAGFRVAPTDGPARTGTVTVAGRTVAIVQSPGCTLTVSPANVNASAGGASVTIDVKTGSGCGWSAAADAPWITLAGPSGSGSGQVHATIAPNAGPARAGSVLVGSQRIAIAQASGCSYAVSPAGQQIAGIGGQASASVAAAAGCAWTAASAVNWIAMTTSSGSGSGQVTFSVAPNLAPSRTGTITIAGQTHTVTQASQCTWSFNPPSHAIGAAGGFGTVLVFVAGGACTWTATSTVDWIRIVAGASGVGGGLVQFTIAPHSGAARTGVVLIGGEKYLVNQAGQ